MSTVGKAQEAVAIITASVAQDQRTAVDLIDTSPDVWMLATVLAGICTATVHMLSEVTGLPVDVVLERLGLWAEELSEVGL